MAGCCAFGETVDQQFTSKKAGKELERYRRKGAGPTTRLLIEGISQTGIAGGTLLVRGDVQATDEHEVLVAFGPLRSDPPASARPRPPCCLR